MNLLDDVHNVNWNFIGLYSVSDTIKGGIPAFTGSSGDWQYAEFHWIWVALVKSALTEIEALPILKFRFISDDMDSGKDGWMIDQIVFRGYDISGDISGPEEIKIRIYPNPCTDFLHADFPREWEKSCFRLFGISGNLLISEELMGPEDIDVSELLPGIYYYTVSDVDQIKVSGKLIKQ
jgi:hypothetical protein